MIEQTLLAMTLMPVKKTASGFFTALDTQVRLGINAPKDVVVDREEVHQRKVAEYTLEASRASAKRENAARPADSAADATS